MDKGTTCKCIYIYIYMCVWLSLFMTIIYSYSKVEMIFNLFVLKLTACMYIYMICCSLLSSWITFLPTWWFLLFSGYLRLYVPYKNKEAIRDWGTPMCRFFTQLLLLCLHPLPRVSWAPSPWIRRLCW